MSTHAGSAPIPTSMYTSPFILTYSVSLEVTDIHDCQRYTIESVCSHRCEPLQEIECWCVSFRNHSKGLFIFVYTFSLGIDSDSIHLLRRECQPAVALETVEHVRVC